MKNIFKVYCLFCCGLLVLGSCTDPDTRKVIKTNTDLLTQSAWKFKDHFRKGTYDTIVWNIALGCTENNILYFHKSKKVEEQHAENCRGKIAPFEGTTWEFNKNQSVLFIGKPYGVAELTEYRLVLVDTLAKRSDSLFAFEKWVLEH